MKKWMTILSFLVLLSAARMAAASSPEVLLGDDVTGQTVYEVCDVVLDVRTTDHVNLDKTCLMSYPDDDINVILPARAELPADIRYAIALYEEKEREFHTVFVFKVEDLAAVKAHLDAKYQRLEQPVEELKKLGNSGDFWTFNAAGKVWYMGLDADEWLFLLICQKGKCE